MSDIAVRVEGLSKRYRLGTAERYRTLRETITGALKSPFRSAPQAEDLWALNNVSFEINRGEVVGIIGRNGAGKSTLLKILSRITEPTCGQAEIRGRVGSLLEVGTGFHPELTGRENIFLNGAILGMKKAEIQRKFAEIVAFADVERFLDTAVKHYSSGMYVRLAFAVAAHLDPEILTVDEVLSVGDAAFQEKCLGAMERVSGEGRTILLVSHQMASIQKLCRSAMLLRNGRVATLGPTDSVVSSYLDEARSAAGIPLESRKDRRGTGAIRFTGIRTRIDSSRGVCALVSGRTAILELPFTNNLGPGLRSLTVSIGIDTHHGQRILCLDSDWVKGRPLQASSVADCIEITIPDLPLAPGRYGLTLFATVNGDIADWVKDAGFLHVEPGDFYGTGKLPPADQGSILVRHTFQVREFVSA